MDLKPKDWILVRFVLRKPENPSAPSDMKKIARSFEHRKKLFENFPSFGNFSNRAYSWIILEGDLKLLLKLELMMIVYFIYFIIPNFLKMNFLLVSYHQPWFGDALERAAHSVIFKLFGVAAKLT